MKKNSSKRIYTVIICLLITVALTTCLFQKTLVQLVSSSSKDYVQGSKEWLTLKIKLASKEGKAAFELGQYFANKADHKESILWFKQAIRLGVEEANTSLASLYFEGGNFELAQKTLHSSVFTKDESYALLAIKIALEIGDLHYIEAHYSVLKDFAKGQDLLQKLIRYQVIENVESAVSQSPSVLSCKNSIQFIATNLSDLAHSEYLIKRVSEHPLSAHFCFHPVIYQPASALQCRDPALNLHSDVIQCDESIWRDKTVPVNTRYLAVLLPQGGANVHKGILYLDRFDSVDVFLHELSHLLGFVDEYALPEEHIACVENQSQTWAYNIAVLPEYYQGKKAELRESILKLIPWRKFIHADTPILQASQKGWALGTPNTYSDKVGIFASETCARSSRSSFKPLNIATMLTYNEVEFPALYIDLLTNTADDFRMPSYHLNVATALWLKGEEQEAERWFELLQP